MKIKNALKLIPAALSCLVASFSHGEGFGHDRLQPWSNNNIDQLITRYQPSYSWDEGCTSHTGVGSGIDQYNNGLKPGGKPGGSCRNEHLAHTVAYLWTIPESMRPLYQNNRYAIMYANYFPKDQGNRQGSVGGHRHDWEEVVVYVGNDMQVQAAYHSYHGDYIKTTPNRDSHFFHEGRPKTSYQADGLKNNSFMPTQKVGWTVPIVQINDKSDSENARQTLEVQYGCGGGAKVKDCNRMNKFNKANEM